MSAEHHEHHDKKHEAPHAGPHAAETGIVATLKKIYLWGKRRIAEVLEGGDAHGHGHGTHGGHGGHEAHGEHAAESKGHEAAHDAKGHSPDKPANDTHIPKKDDHHKDDHHKKAA